MGTFSVPSPREAFVLWQPPCVRDWSGILLERGTGNGEQGTELVEVTVVLSRERGAGSKDRVESPTASPERPKQCTINNVQLTMDGLISS